MKESFTNYSKSTLVVDVLFLIIVSSLLQVYIIKGLGFYSDDWIFLSMLHNSKDNSVLGLMSSLFAEPSVIVRPVFVLQLAILHKIFGENPLGYHLINLLFIIIEVVFLYLGLRQLKLGRIIEVGLPLIYIFLPHYSTTHVWIACFNANVSMAFFFLNLYANLKAVNTNKYYFISNIWLLLGLISLIISVLSYEVVVPLFFISFLIIWIYLISMLRYAIKEKIRICMFLIINLFTLVSCIIFKILYTNRQGGFGVNYTGQIYDTAKAAVINDFYTYGIKLPKVVWTLFSGYGNVYLILYSVTIFVFIFLYTLKIYKNNYFIYNWMKTIVFGIIVYFTGYATFLATSQIQITSTGVSNRVETAAAVGIAICYLGVIGLVCSFIKAEQAKRLVFAGAVALLCTSGYIIKCTISGFFSNSYTIQLQVLNNIFASFPTFDSKNTLIVDGLCPYEGPAPVFECYWDMGCALRMHYSDAAIRADVRTKRLTYTKEGIDTEVYGEKKFYPFSEKLLIYNINSRKQYKLSSFEVANSYFLQNPIDNRSCSQGEPGYGLPIF